VDKAGGRKRKSLEGKELKKPTVEIFEEKGIPLLLSGRYGFAVAFLLIAVTALLIYSDTFSYPFHFDGTGTIVENNKLRDLSNFWPPTGTRYTGYLSFALNYHFGGLDVFGYHLVNILIHIINGFLVWSLVTLTFKTPVMERATADSQLKYFIALTASLLFISHPVQTQAVTYIVQRFASLATLFYLLSLVLYIKARLSNEGQGLGAKNILFGLASLLAAVLAMKTKEISFTLPFVVLLYEIMFFDYKDLSLKRFLYLVPISLTIFIIPLSLIGIDKPLGDVIGEFREAAQETEAVPRGIYLLTQFRVIVTYIRLLILPANQNLDYDYPLYNSPFEPGVFFSFIFLFSFFGLAIYLFKRSRKTDNVYALLASFGILWFFITLSVESSIIPIRDVIFEHRLYLPSVGAVIVFCSAAYHVFDYVKPNVSPFVATCVLLIITVFPLGGAGYARNLVWKDEVTLWEDVVRKSPGKVRGHYSLGTSYDKKGRMEEAISKYKEALRLNPDHSITHNNLGLAYSRQGRIDEAITEFKEARRLSPDLAKAHYNLGKVYNSQGRIDEAIAEYKETIRLKSDFSSAYNNLGLVYFDQGRILEAIEEYKAALRLAPDAPEPHYNMGNAYFNRGRIDEAIEEFKEAVRLKPDLAEAYNNIATAYAMQGRMDEAVKELEQAIRFKPDYTEARNNLGAAYFNQGRIDEAIEEYKKAINLNPDYVDARYNLGIAYKRKGLKDEAIREFEEALRIKPDFEQARKMLQSLSR
jgi:tetratricopeptide (TPR) repeat protein